MKNYIKLSITLFSTLVLFNSCTKTPEACITVENNSVPYFDDTINFQSCSLGGSNYFWDFGDGSTSTEINPSHVFHVAGDYSVLLTVTSDNGKKSSSIIFPFHIYLPPPKHITITKVVLTKFPDTFIDPNLSMVFSIDSVNILVNNQVYYNCKQGIEYTFSDGFPQVYNSVYGNFPTAKFEFLDFRDPNDFTMIGSQSLRLNGLYYAMNDEYNTGHFDWITLSGIEFQIYFELEF